MRRLFSFLLLIVLLACAAPAYGAPEAGGSPNAMEFRADTALWSIVVFAGLFAILYFKAWPQVLEGLQKREETIRSSLEEAKKVRAEMPTAAAISSTVTSSKPRSTNRPIARLEISAPAKSRCSCRNDFMTARHG